MSTTDTMHVVVQVRPKGAGPFYWSHQIVEAGHGSHFHGLEGNAGDPTRLICFDWATISCEVAAPLGDDPDDDDDASVVKVTGYAIGYHLHQAIEWKLVEHLIDAWFDAHDEENWLWEFRMVPLPASTA